MAQEKGPQLAFLQQGARAGICASLAVADLDADGRFMTAAKAIRWLSDAPARREIGAPWQLDGSKARLAEQLKAQGGRVRGLLALWGCGEGTPLPPITRLRAPRSSTQLRHLRARAGANLLRAACW